MRLVSVSPLPAVTPVFNLTQEVVNLTIGGTHKDFWINYPSRRITCSTILPSEISNSQSPGVAETKNTPVYLFPKLLCLEAIISCTRQAKSMLNQNLFRAWSPLYIPQFAAL